MKLSNGTEILASAAATLERSTALEQARAQGNQGGGGAAAAAANAAPEASAQIALSSSASTMLESNSDEGSFDLAKVQRISQAIAQGKFTVNAENIADKLISNAQELVSRATPH